MSLTREQWDLQFPNDPLPNYLGIDGQFIPERYIPFDTTNLKTHDVIVSEDGQYLMYFKADKSYKIYDQSPFKFLVNPFKEWKKFGYELPVDDIKKSIEEMERCNTTKSQTEILTGIQKSFEKQLVWGEKWKDASQATRNNDMVIDPYPMVDNKVNPIQGEFVNNEWELYFTPSIEDIRTGYEFQRLPKWAKGKGDEHIFWEDWVWSFGDVNGWETSIEEGRIRVPYLTKEQIEKEGWINDGKNYDGGSFDRKTPEYTSRIEYDYITRQMIIYYTDESREYLDVRFEGECKDINTFRYICKLLKI